MVAAPPWMSPMISSTAAPRRLISPTSRCAPTPCRIASTAMEAAKPNTATEFPPPSGCTILPQNWGSEASSQGDDCPTLRCPYLLGGGADRSQCGEVEDCSRQAAVLHDQRGEQSPQLAAANQSPVALKVLEQPWCNGELGQGRKTDDEHGDGRGPWPLPSLVEERMHPRSQE
jgi:hypothetical protein